MSYASILVHVATDPDHMERLRTAHAIARRFSAHLQAACVAAPTQNPLAGRGASVNFLKEESEILAKKIGELEAEVKSWASDSSEIVDFNVEHAEGQVVKILARKALTADLAIVSQAQSHGLEDWLMEHTPEHLAQVASCPVMVLPTGYKHGAWFREAALFWRSTRECGRILRDATPLLRTMESVWVLTASDDKADRPDAATTYLRRHGVNVRAAEVPGSHGRFPGEKAMLDHCKENGVDLICLGAYQHRLRDLVFGDTAHRVLEDYHLPVLMAH